MSKIFVTRKIPFWEEIKKPPLRWKMTFTGLDCDLYLAEQEDKKSLEKIQNALIEARTQIV